MAGDLLAFLPLFFLVLIVLRIPVSYPVLLTNLVCILLSRRIPMLFIPQGMISGFASYNVMCSPFFIVVDCAMNKAGVTDEIFELADCLVGHIKGGLERVNVATNLIFTGMSGSANADIAGLGNIEIKAMAERGFDRDFTVDITTTSSVIGPTFPLSNSMVYVGIMAGVSIGALLLGGIAVGILMMLFMCIAVYAAAHKRNYLVGEQATVRETCHASRKGFWTSITPVVLVFCIQNGNATPTEARAVALVYTLFVSMFIYKAIKFKDLYGIVAQAINSIGLVLVLVSSGKVFARTLGDQQVAEIAPKGLFSLTTNPWLILLLISLLLLFLGMFMESVTAIIITALILFSIALSIGPNSVQPGVISVLNLAIGVLAPLMTVTLLITSKTGEVSSEKAFKTVLPYYVTLLLVLMLVNLSPVLTLGLPDSMPGGYK